MREIVSTGPWKGGINSLVDPQFIGDDEVQWSTNTINRGGVYQTRPGRKMLYDSEHFKIARGMTVFRPRGADSYLVKAVGDEIRISQAPFTSWTTLAGISGDLSDSQVTFQVAVKGAMTNDDGTLSRIDPYPVLMIQWDGKVRAAYWDGTVARHLNPDKAVASETPAGTWMKWIGSRLWISNGSRLRVSNILDPLKFTEEDILSEGGILTLPGECTGLGETADFQSLLAFTAESTTAFAAGNQQREPDPITGQGGWLATPGFQQVILPQIGCVAGKTIINQYGITWFLSQGGLIGLDGALQTYRTSKIHYKDQNMSRSKANLSPDVSRSCTGSYENFLFLSVPSGDAYNAQTWVMDQGIIETLDNEAAPAWASSWTGTRPVEWVTASIDGQSRCFSLSHDYPAIAETVEFRTGVWEEFLSVKHDITRHVGGVETTKPISCSLETKRLSKDASYKTFSNFKVRLTELSGVWHLDGFYASEHSGYKQVLSKDGVSTTAALDTYENLNITGIVPALIRQTRLVRSSTDQARLSDQDAGVEDPDTRNKGTSFSVLLQWTGQVGISYVMLSYDASGEPPDGAVEKNETRVRKVFPSGVNTIGTATPAPVLVSDRRILHSSAITAVTARWYEPTYSSLA